MRSASVLQVGATEDGAEEIARRARGTPRIANRLLKRVRDFAQVQFDGTITKDVARSALDKMEIDKVGLDTVDKKILQSIIFKFDGGPVGLDTLASSIDEEAGTLEDMAEPYLLQLGFIQRTPRGRIVTRLGYAHLGVDAPAPEAAGQQIGLGGI
jgi:Holliday junction DNA helicase RuvB